MRGKAVRIILCCVIVLAVPVCLAAFAFALPPQYGETFLGGLSLKYDALRKAEGKRIVVIGGSGVAFDLRSDLLEQEIPGYSVVNFGLYAGLGTTVMLDLAQPLLRAGDVVIFAPEESEQTLSTYFNPEAMWQAADGTPALLTALGGEYAGPMTGQFPYFAAAKARLARDGSAPTGDGVYARSSFNAWGDIDCPGREQNVMAGGYDPNMPLVFDPALPSEDFVEKVAAFAADCREKGVTFYYRFCPMNAAAATGAEQARLDAFSDALMARLGCELLGDPNDALMAPAWFFDTNFHLNSAGAVAGTAILAADLKAALGDNSPVAIALPEPPPMAETELVSGDNADADYFTYEINGDALRVTGLTGEGKARERLTVPVSYNGVPVTAFAPESFAGNTTIREIIIQSNITTIEDGSFDGCAALERIAVDNAAPERCTVGSGLLNGTDAFVYVPAARYSAYCTNYFWSVHAARLRADETIETEPAPETPAPPAAPVQSGPAIRYMANGGKLKYQDGDSFTGSVDYAHLRRNTAQGASYFRRDGYVLTGWNTAPDGSGTAVGLGSRTERQDGLVLYAQWAKAAPEADFTYEISGGEAHITGYTGANGTCTVPETLGGLPVRRICAGAFRNSEFDTLALPSALQIIEGSAFSDCMIREIFLFDSLREISDSSFSGCTGLQTLHVNAAAAPVYSGSYYDTFSDKYDWLLSIRDERKIVLFSGSSGRYGYDTPAILAAFPGYQAANMGVYAWTNALPQLELIRGLMREGDILLSAPEFDAIEAQFCTTNALDAHFWAMMESNYDAAALLDLRNYSAVFDSFGEYLRIRSGMAGKNYGESPASYDDDGNRYAFPTYNRYGDFTLPRPNGDKDERQHANIADYTVASFPMEYIDSMNAVYAGFLSDGVTVYFSYTPRNRSSLTAESTPEARRALHEYLSENLCVPVISGVEDFLLSGVYFWKIDSHPSTEGARLRTAQVIEDLRAALAK